MKYFFLILLIIIPLRAQAFSEEFKHYMTSLQTRVMLKGGPLTEEDRRTSWKKFDEEILEQLSKGELSEDKLNAETSRTQFSIVEKQGSEIEPIELGTAEVKFQNLRGGTKPVWLAILINDMGSKIATTFHVFSKNHEKFERVLALEEIKGVWDSEKITSSAIQIQKMKGGNLKFSSYHMMPEQNRSQIVWDDLRPVLWCPEVDYHRIGPDKVTGRGPCEGI